MLASILLVGCSTFSRHCRTNLSAHWRKFSLAASGLSHYFVDYRGCVILLRFRYICKPDGIGARGHSS